MTYRDLITAIRRPGPVVLTTMAANSVLYVEVVKADLIHQLTVQAEGDLDQDSEWEIHRAGRRSYLEPA